VLGGQVGSLVVGRGSGHDGDEEGSAAPRAQATAAPVPRRRGRPRPRAPRRAGGASGPASPPWRLPRGLRPGSGRAGRTRRTGARAAGATAASGPVGAAVRAGLSRDASRCKRRPRGGEVPEADGAFRCDEDVRRRRVAVGEAEALQLVGAATSQLAIVRSSPPVGHAAARIRWATVPRRSTRAGATVRARRPPRGAGRAAGSRAGRGIGLDLREEELPRPEVAAPRLVEAALQPRNPPGPTVTSPASGRPTGRRRRRAAPSLDLVPPEEVGDLFARDREAEPWAPRIFIVLTPITCPASFTSGLRCSPG